MTGVRKFLIAYNINLLSTKEQAHRLKIFFLAWLSKMFCSRIALNIREKGRGDDQPGRLKAVQVRQTEDQRDPKICFVV